MNLGDYLKELRIKNKLSQRALAQMSNISNAEISRIESGERSRPSSDTLRALSNILGVSHRDLMLKAGYMDESVLFKKKVRITEENFINIIAPLLIKEGWSIKLSTYSSIADILAIRDNYYWYIDFKSSQFHSNLIDYTGNKFHYMDFAIRCYGRISMFDKTPISKFTIAVDDINMFSNLKKFPPKNLSIPTSIMLIDFNTNCIIDEYIFY